MREPSRKFSINEHFRREGLFPAIAFGAMIAVAVLAAVVGPWIYDNFR
jgi:hypothetical protein